MKITINKEFLFEKISLANHFTSSKISSVSALSGVLMKGDGKLIHFYSSNLSSYFHTFLKTDKDNDFEIVIDPKKILEFLSLLQPGNIEVEVKEREITISKEKTRGKFSLISAKDFPLPPALKGKEQKIKSEFLLDNLPLVLFSASSDESRPALSGVNFLTQDEDVLIISTDGFRLSLLKTKKEINLPQTLIPKEFLAEFIRNIKDEKEIGVSYLEDEKIVVFKAKENEFFSRLIEGEFPPFERVIPAESKTKIILDKEEFLRNIKTISVFAREFSNVLICDFKKDGLYLRPKTDVEDQASSYQEIKLEGLEQKVAFNFKFLIDFLNQVSAKKIQIEILRPDAPTVFRLEGKDNFLHIIMPVRIQE